MSESKTSILVEQDSARKEGRRTQKVQTDYNLEVRKAKGNTQRHFCDEIQDIPTFKRIQKTYVSSSKGTSGKQKRMIHRMQKKA